MVKNKVNGQNPGILIKILILQEKGLHKKGVFQGVE